MMFNGRAGYSLVETMVVLALFTVASGSVWFAMENMGRASSGSTARARLQQEGEEAIQRIASELSRAGTVVVDGKTYPYVFDGGNAEVPFGVHWHEPPSGEDIDPSIEVREIVFVLPADLDGDGRPDRDADQDGVPELDGDGDGVRTDDFADVDGLWDPDLCTVDPLTGLVWSHEEISYTVRTDPEGRDVLERRAGAVDVDRVARGVVAARFDTAESSGWSLPPDTIRVRLVFRQVDRRGVEYTYEVETILRLRNG